jgi:hypothetical protein
MHKKLEEDIKTRNESVQCQILEKRAQQFAEISSSRSLHAKEAVDAIQGHVRNSSAQFEELRKQKRDEDFSEVSRVRRLRRHSVDSSVSVATSEIPSPNSKRKVIENEIRTLRSAGSVRDIASKFTGQSVAESEEIYRKRILQQKEVVEVQRRKARAILARVQGEFMPKPEAFAVDDFDFLTGAQKRGFLEAWANMSAQNGETCTPESARQFLLALGISEQSVNSDDSWSQWEIAMSEISSISGLATRATVSDNASAEGVTNAIPEQEAVTDLSVVGAEITDSVTVTGPHSECITSAEGSNSLISQREVTVDRGEITDSVAATGSYSDTIAPAGELDGPITQRGATVDIRVEEQVPQGSFDLTSPTTKATISDVVQPACDEAVVPHDCVAGDSVHRLSDESSLARPSNEFSIARPSEGRPSDDSIRSAPLDEDGNSFNETETKAIDPFIEIYPFKVPEYVLQSTAGLSVDQPYPSPKQGTGVKSMFCCGS